MSRDPGEHFIGTMDNANERWYLVSEGNTSVQRSHNTPEFEGRGNLNDMFSASKLDGDFRIDQGLPTHLFDLSGEDVSIFPTLSATKGLTI